jgi:hypothetical protein
MFAGMPLDNLDGKQIRDIRRYLGLAAAETSPRSKRSNVSLRLIVL